MITEIVNSDLCAPSGPADAGDGTPARSRVMLTHTTFRWKAAGGFVCPGAVPRGFPDEMLHWSADCGHFQHRNPPGRAAEPHTGGHLTRATTRKHKLLCSV